MISASSVSYDDLSMSVRMIRDEAVSRGWKVEFYYSGNGQMRITRPDGKVLEVFNATPPTTKMVDAHLANNKFLSFHLLEENKLPLPITYLAKHLKEAEKLTAQLVKDGYKAVIKPLSAAHGHGVTVGVSRPNQIKPAVKRALEFSDKVIVQEFLEDWVDLRLTCINYRFTAGLIRLPARVQGDGKHTVLQLIEKENKNPRRGEKYKKSLNKIDPDLARKFLGNRVKRIPKAGEYVAVIGTANVGAGGETVDITDTVPAWLAALAEKVAKTLKLPSAGVDIMVQKSPEKSDDWEALNPKIIEINICPALFLHETPTFGKPRPVIKAYVDYLAII